MSDRRPYCGHMEHNLRCIQKLSKNKSSKSPEHKFVESSLRSSNDVSAGFPVGGLHTYCIIMIRLPTLLNSAQYTRCEHVVLVSLTSPFYDAPINVKPQGGGGGGLPTGN